MPSMMSGGNSNMNHNYLPLHQKDVDAKIGPGELYRRKVDVEITVDHSHSTWRFLYLVGGVFLFYCMYGIFQERIFRDPELKKYGWYVTWVQFIFYTVMSMLVERSFKQSIPLNLYCVIAGLTVATMACSNSSLQYLSYPTQVIFKSSKLIPVMIGGVLIQGKVYGILDYAASVCMSLGLIFFTLADAKVKEGAETQINGLILICMALCADAVIGNVQEKWIKLHKPTNGEVIMYSYGIGSFMVLAKCVVDGSFYPATAYSMEHVGESYGLIFGFSLCGYLGVKFVLDLVREYGALLAVTVTTCRKAATMVLSFLIFPKPFTLQHFFSGFLVIVGLCLNIYKKNKARIDPILYEMLERMGDMHINMSHYHGSRAHVV
eukprot:Nk52_evm64s1737 gene=Nk52_evmTU64s1737